MTPSSFSKADNNTSSSILTSDPALSPVLSVSLSSTPHSAPEVNNHPPSVIYNPRPDWSTSNFYNTPANNWPGDLTQRSECNTLPSIITYHPGPPFSESNEYYNSSTDLSQGSESLTLPTNTAHCPKPHWVEENLFCQLPEQGSIYNTQLGWLESYPFTSTVSGTART